MLNFYKIFFIFCLFLGQIIVFAQEKQSAIYTDFKGESVFLPEGDASFADRVVAYHPGMLIEDVRGRYKKAESALHPPNYTQETQRGMVVLGCGGSIILEFTDNYLVDVAGIDIYVFEVGYTEPTELEISKDGKNWVNIGKIDGGSVAVDIAPYVEEGDKFRFIQLYDLGERCDVGNPGADIDAVAAVGSEIIPEIEQKKQEKLPEVGLTPIPTPPKNSSQTKTEPPVTILPQNTDPTLPEIDWNTAEFKYYHKREIFKITPKDIEPIYIEVPEEEAAAFNRNLRKLKIFNTKITEKLGTKIIQHIEITNPENQMKYVYDKDKNRSTERRAILEKTEVVYKEEIMVDAPEITVKIWDDEKEDGDVVSLFLNQECVLSKYLVKKEKGEIKIKLNQKENTLVLVAENLGKEPPNTAAININDGKTTQTVTLNAEIGKSEAIKIVRR